MNSTQDTQRPAYSPPTPPVRTLEDFRLQITAMTADHQLTAASKDLVKACEWKFVGDSYRQAWGYLFARAGVLGLTYSKHFKRFYKPLPAKPAIGDRVKLIVTGATGIVTGYHRFDMLVRIDDEEREAEVSPQYLAKI